VLQALLETMVTSCKEYTPIDEATRARLTRDFIPRLDRMKLDRARERNLMLGVLLCIPFVTFVVGIIVVVRFWGADDVKFLGALAWALSSLAGTLALTFVWIGKLRACDDAPAIISGSLCLGSMELILDSIEHIACYGKFKGLINDIQRVVTRPEKSGQVPGGGD